MHGPGRTLSSVTAGETRRGVVIAVCFAAIVFDGYDLIIFGSTMPALLAYEPWGLTSAEAGTIASAALLGMFFGAISAGPLTERFGRRRLFLGCLILYSIAMIFVSIAPNPGILMAVRFIAGIGFGGIAPVAIALVLEVARPHERNKMNALMLSGLPVGGILAALLSLLLLDHLGFRVMWAFGAVALVTVAPLAWRYIPETGRTGGARDGAGPAVAIRKLTSSGRSVAALALFAVANFIGFLLVFGLNTWLPQLMRDAGYSLGSALTFQLLLNGGAVIGGIGGAVLADRWGPRPVAVAFFALATATILLMATAPPAAVLGAITFFAGAGTIGTQMIVFGFVGTYFDADVRATALGTSTGIGRLGAVLGPAIAGVILSAGLSYVAAFFFFAAAALVGLVACLLVPRRSSTPRESSAEAVTGLSTTRM